jgi:Alginate export
MSLALCAAHVAAASPAADSGWTTNFDGELRERYESARNPDFGLTGPRQESYWLQRLRAAADIRHGNRFAAKLELVSGLVSQNDWQPPTQDDPLDLLQGYIEAGMEAFDGELSLRAGRQEVSLGSSRLVSVRESPNVRRSFDGLRGSWRRRDIVIDAFLLQPVVPRDGIWDDRSSSSQRLWGLYSTVPLQREVGFDLYYLGLQRRDALFAQGRGQEKRHTVGSRLAGSLDHVDFNVEAAWQWGEFGDASIRAWTFSMDVGYTWNVSWQPRLGLKADAISGDRDPFDRSLGTFNPLFPKLPYFSEANLVAPANLLDVQPSFALQWPARVRWEASWNMLWKYARADAFYSPPLIPVPDTPASRHNDIGRQISAGMEWTATNRLSLGATYVDYAPGGVVRDAGGSAGNFFTAWLRFEF